MKKIYPSLFLIPALFFAACIKNNECSSKAEVIKSDAANPTLVVINGQTITEKDFDSQITGRDKGAMIKARSEMFEAQKSILDDLVFEKLVEAEAKKKNITSEEFIKREIESKIKPVKDKEVEDFYKSVKLQYEKAGKVPPPLNDAVKGQIKSQLSMKSLGERRGALYAEMLKKNKVTYLLEQPRVQVDVGSHPMKGSSSAKVTIIEFSDFQCPYCEKGAKILKQVEKKYGDKIKVYFRDFPLSFHERAVPAANATHCAMEQGKFWEAHDKLFEDQSKLQDDDLIALGKDLKLDMAKYEPCVKTMAKKADVDKDQQAGEDAGVSGTPAYFINGIFLSGALPMTKFEEVIDAELKK